MRKIQFIIYHTSFLLYKKIMFLLNPNILEIWYRNSLTQNYWVFAKSDIDITILVNAMSFKSGKKIGNNHLLLRKFIPIIGEICFYDKEKMDQLKICINPIELERDPELIKRIGSKGEIKSVDKLVFLNKFFINTIFKKDFSNRNKKIEYYIKVAQCNSSAKDGTESIKKIITEIAGIKNFDHYTYLSKQTLLTKRIPDFNDISSVEYSLLFNFLAHLKLKMQFTPLDLEIIKSNLYWELWGIYSYQFFAHDNISHHVKNILDLSREILSSQDQLELEHLAMQLELI